MSGNTFFSFNGYTVYLDKQNIIELKPVVSNCYESIAYECDFNEYFRSTECTESGKIEYIDNLYECEFNEDFRSVECTESGKIEYIDNLYECEYEEEIEISYTRKVKDITT